MDIAFLKALQALRTPVLDLIFHFITLFGEEVLLVAAVCLIYWCLNKRLAMYMLFNFFVGGMLNALLKATFCVPRPWLRDPELVPVTTAKAGATGFSFPSGHTASAVATYGSLAMYFRRRWVTVTCCAMALLVGFSRLYLGVHTPQDVLVSLAVGAALLFVVRRLFDWLDREPGAEGIVFWSGLALGVALILYAQFKPYPDSPELPKLVLDSFKVGGATMGLFLGWRFERRFVRFDVAARLAEQLLKYALGMAIVGAILMLKGPDVPGWDRIWAMARYLLLAFTALGLWPWCFTKWLVLAREREKEDAAHA